ncbi:MAG: NYN domain-containing protein [Lachnospiraceae bacterium]|nr:NYN domain-containing protein [Lachnospiraceae bacterium]
MQEKQVAILIDGDNISPRYAEYIKQEAARLGRIKVFRLYGSIASPNVRIWYKIMPKHGITPMLQISYAHGKSIADQALTIDAMDILYGGEIDIICLVTSDSDFTKLAYRIKESGKVLIGMGEKKANESLAQACDEFKVLDLIYQIEEGTVVPEMNEEDDAEEQQDVIVDADDEETISVPQEEEIINCILNMLEEDWENLASVGIYLKKRISGFDARNYGYKNMTQLIQGNKDKFDVKFELGKDGVHTIVFVRRKV